MAIKVYDFKCSSCGTLTEGFVEAGTHTTRCACGSTAHRVVSIPNFALDPTSGHFPTATDKWIREHEEAGAKTTENTRIRPRTNNP